MYLSFYFKALGHNLRFTIGNDDKLIWTGGVASRLRDGYYIPMFDYDSHDKEWVIDDIGWIQEEHELGTAYVFRSSERGFHVYIPDKMRYRAVKNVIVESSCDLMYKSDDVKRIVGQKTWVLRNLEKGDKGCPKFIETIPRSGKYVRSLAHLEFLKGLGVDVSGEVDENDGKNIDANLIFVTYQTRV